MFNHKRRSLTAAATVGALAGLFVLLSEPSAAADSIQHINGTGGDGLWLHTNPGLSTDLIAVIAEGEEITAHCYTYADEVSSPTSSADPVWLLVTSSAGDGWVSDAYVDTWWSTTTDLEAAGISACASGDLGGQSAAGSDLVLPDVAISYDGDPIVYSEGFYPLSYALWDHYLWSGGTAAVPDAGYFTNTPGFRDAIQSLPIGGFGTWSSDPTTDLFLAVGTFTISRESDRCWAAYDRYDFNPDKLANVFYLPYWAYQVSGAREFDVHASGCF